MLKAPYFAHGDKFWISARMKHQILLDAANDAPNITGPHTQEAMHATKQLQRKIKITENCVSDQVPILPQIFDLPNKFQ